MSVFCDSYTGTDVEDDDKPEGTPQGEKDPKPEVKPGIPMTLPRAPLFGGPGGM